MIQVNQGKVNKYIGMKLDHIIIGRVNITMVSYMDELLNAFDMSDPTSSGTMSSSAPIIILS